jgi:Bacterial Ig-like domain/RTX calcium-binding nonapeptide repeat (4 copies)
MAAKSTGKTGFVNAMDLGQIQNAPDQLVLKRGVHKPWLKPGEVLDDQPPMPEVIVDTVVSEGAEWVQLPGQDAVVLAQAASASTAATGTAEAAGASTAAASTATTVAAAGATAGLGLGGVLLGVAGLGLALKGGGDDVPRDTTAPAAPAITGVTDNASPTTGAVIAGGATNDNTPTIMGTAEANATVKIFNGSTELGNATADESGNWSFTPTNALTDGEYSLTATATDAAGNTGAASTAQTFIVDTTAPVAPTIDAVAGDNVVNAAEQSSVISGTNEAGATVNLSIGGQVRSAIVAGTTWSYTLTAADITNMGQGAETVSVTQTDAAGNASAVATLAITVDTALVVADGYIRGAQIYLDTPTGLVAVDGVTTDADGKFYLLPDQNPSNYPIVAVGGVNIDTGLPNTLPLKAPAGSTVINPLTTLVQAVLEANPSSSAAEASAQVAQSLGLSTGVDLTSYDPLQALAEDANNAVALAAQKAAVQVVTVVQLIAQSAGGDLSAAAEAVVSSLVKQITVDPQQTTELDLTSTTLLDQVVTATATALETAVSVNTIELAATTTTISSASTLASVVTTQAQALDTTAPDAPTAVTLVGGATASLTNDSTPVISISLDTLTLLGKAAVAGDMITISGAGATPMDVVLTSADIAAGGVTVDLQTLSDGSHDLTVQVVDKAGNTSGSTSLSVSVDSTAPAAPTISQVTASTNDTTPTIAGMAEANATVNIYNNGTTLLGTATANGSGAWSFTPITALTDDTYSLTATATDLAGNEGTASTAQTFTVDTVAPAMVTISGIDANSGSAGDRSTADRTPVLTVTAEAGLTLRVGTGGQAIDSTLYPYTVVDSTSGTYTITFTGELPDGGYGVVAVDAAGNVSTATAGTSSSFRIDNMAPEPVVIMGISENSGATSDRVTNDNTPTLTVTAEAGLTLRVGTGGQAIDSTLYPYTVVESPSGTYTITFTGALPDGGYGVVAVDGAGNVSAATAGTTSSFRIDTTAPTLATDGVLAIDGADGQYDAGDTIRLTFAEPMEVSSLGLSQLSVLDGTFGEGAMLEAENPVDGYSTTFVLTLGAGVTMQSGSQINVAVGALVDVAGNANASELDVMAPLLQEPQGFDFYFGGEQKIVMVPGLEPNSFLSYQSYEVSRFGVVVAVFEHFDSAVNDYVTDQLRVIDLETGAVLAQRQLADNEFLLRTEDSDQLFHIGSEVNGTVTVTSYAYGLDSTDTSIAQVVGQPVTVTLPTNLVDSTSFYLNQYVPATANSPAYVLGTDVVSQTGTGDQIQYIFGPVLYSAQPGGELTQLSVPEGVYDWIGGAFVNAEGNLAVYTGSYASNNSYWQLTTEGWASVLESDFWDGWDVATGYRSVLRDGAYALDLRSLVDGSGQSIWYDQDRVEPLTEGGLLVRAEVYSATEDYELWVVFQNGQVVAEKAFSTDAGFGMRSINDPVDGYVYFQVVNGQVQRDTVDNTVIGFSQVTDGAATTVYKIALADVATVLNAAASTDTLAGLTGVTQVTSYTRAQLGVTDTNVVGLLDGFIEPNTYLNQTNAVALVTAYNFSTDTDTVYLNVYDGSTLVKSNLLTTEVADITIDPDHGVFFKQYPNAEGVELAYHLNWTSGVLSQITAGRFDEIALNGGVPNGVTFVSGTDAGDTLDHRTATTSEWIASGEGNDSVVGGSANDFIMGGAGNDTLVGAGGSDTVVGQGGDDRLFGRGGEDYLFGGPGTDRVIYDAPAELTGDHITGSRNFWDGYADTLVAGGDTSTVDRIMLRGAGTYDFSLAAEVDYIDRIDIVTNVANTTQGDFKVVLTADMAASADQNSDSNYGDIAVLGYDGSVSGTSTPMSANVEIDASLLTAEQRLIFLGQNEATSGMGGNDTIFGGAGNDYIHGGKGNDSIDGGGGSNDIVAFTGQFSDYVFSETEGVVTATDVVTGRDGVDTFTNIERLRFLGESNAEYTYSGTAWVPVTA